MNENVTDKARAEILRLFKYGTLFGLCMWGIQLIGPGAVDMSGFLVVYGPLTLGVGIGETANIAKRATSNPEVILAEAHVRNGDNGCDEDPQ